MINFVDSNDIKYFVTMSPVAFQVGRDEIRVGVKCELYSQDHTLLSSGVSICHPVDEFNPRKGAHLALKAATQDWFDSHDTSRLHAKIDKWYQ